MDSEHIIKTCEAFKNKVCLFLKENLVYSGEVQDYGKTSLLIKDRNNKLVPIDYAEIRYIRERNKDEESRKGNK